MQMLSSFGRAAMLLACAAAIGCTGPTASDSGESPEAESAAGAGSAGAPSEAPAGSIAIAPSNASIGFVGSKAEGSHTGGFKEFSGYFLPPADGEPGKISLTIATPSLWSDNEKLTGHLKNPDFFDVPNHPEAMFESTEIKSSEDDAATHEVTGDLTLLGATESITFPVTISGEGDAAALAADFTFDRTKFGMDYGQGKVNNEVQVTVRVGGDAKTE
ncbi:MAG: YceI family protein [Planctomycetales bacterium]|nr:YceI family protein [Planctomycetales bacterium]